MRKFILFLLPLILWVFLFRDFILGVLPFNMDTNTIYAVAKYYFNNLLNGTVPLWEPYVCLGRPFYAIAICNLFNPVTQLIILFKLIGFNYQQAFGFYLVIYFFIGAFGFYDLIKQVLKDKTLAYLGYVAFLFCGVGASVFNQMTLLEIFVPTVWFFSFLLRFAQKPHRGHFWGLVFSSMVLLSAYLPFYFATFFLFFVTGALLFYTRDVFTFIGTLCAFMARHRLQVCLGLIGLSIAALPLLTYKAIDASHEVVSPARHCSNTDPMTCYNNTMNEQGGMSYPEASRSGGLGERLDMGSLFLHLDKISYGMDHFFFVPVWIYFLIILGVFVRGSRLLWLLCFLFTTSALTGLADLSGLHRFLYDTLPFFKYFRNLFFFEVFLMPLLILIALLQLKQLLAVEIKTWTVKKTMLIAFLVVHGAAAFFLYQHAGVIPTIWLTLILSAAFWTLYWLGLLPPKTWIYLLGILCVIEPIQVFSAYAGNAQEFKIPLANEHTQAHFDWVRPLKPSQQPGRIYQFVPYENFWYAMHMKDSSGYVGYSESATRWAFQLERWIGAEELYAYARYKFTVYDRTKNSDDTPLSITQAKEGLVNGTDTAIIPPEAQARDNGTTAPQALRLEGPSLQLSVDHFDVNDLKLTTHFTTSKFLVYNDAYTSRWKVFVNGVSQELVRANFAFKGVWVPAGYTSVEFRYDPPGGGWAYIMTAIVLMAAGIYTLMALYVSRREDQHA